MKKKITIITIAKDEQGMIKECLESSSWADEIILLDTGSTDKTIKIAKDYGAKIILAENKDQNFADWHNQGEKEAFNEWIFYLDADERITPELKKEIQAVIEGEEFDAYAVPRRNILLGKTMRFGGWFPDYQIRLFRKERLIKWQGKLHERPVFKGELGYLKNPMIHITHRDLSSMTKKSNQWSEIEAQLLFKANHPPVVWWRILRIMFSEFNSRFVKQQAWRDGVVGWIEGLFQIFNKFLIYAKLWELQRKK